MASIKPSTTPTLYVAVDTDLSDHTLELTLQDKHVKIIKQDKDIARSITDGNTVLTATLTADETRALIPGTQARLQLRAKLGDIVTASNIGSISIDEILNDQPLED